MKQANTNHKGVLLWVDDNFIDAPFKKDVDTWVSTFGNESDHIYRLMDLQLRIAATYEAGEKTIKELAELVKQGAYVFCIIDLKLPKSIEEKNFLRAEYGMKLAQLAKDNEFNCVFLTTESDRVHEELVEMGLAAIPYYQKEPQEQVIPESLVHYILSNFRSNINWISLEDIYSELNLESSLFDDTFEKNKDSLSIKYFPFLNVFRAFVERWEYLPVPGKRTITIFRSPKSNCDVFIQQCLLFTLNNLVQNYPGHVSFRYTRTANPQYSDHIKDTPTGLTVNAVRVDTDKTSPPEFFRLLEKAAKKNHITYFVLPNDETADEYLEKTARIRGVSYEDLPTLRIEDAFTREAVIRSAISLVLQHVKISAEDREKKRLGDIYLAYPEILVKPLTWVFLLDAHRVSDRFSDPFEIVNEIEKSAKKLQNHQLDPKIRQMLIDGEPIDISHLLEFDFDALKKDEKGKNKKDEFMRTIQEEWMPRALKLWLTKSWQFPYGMEKKVVQAQNQKNNSKKGSELEARWEEFSLQVLVDLVENFAAAGCPVEAELEAVCRFLQHSVIRKLVKREVKEIDDEEWADLLTVKWPHDEYPMSVALSKKLKEAGRYFWVETDHFNLIRIFPSTRLRHRHLDDVINLIGQILEWSKSQCKNLPGEWAFYIEKFVDLILHDQIKSSWKDVKENESLCHDLEDFLKNILPLSVMTYSILDRKLDEEKTSKSLFNKLANAKGFGTLLNIIREIRDKNMFKHIRPSEQWFFASRNKTYDFFYRRHQLTDDYRSRVKRDNFIIELKKNRKWEDVYRNLTGQEQKKVLEIFGKENVNPNMRDMEALDACAREKLFKFLENKDELKETVKCCEKNDVTEVINRFFKGILDYDELKCDEKGKYPFSKILDKISEMNSTYAMLKDTESCREFFQDNALSTFFSSSFDVFELCLNANEKFSMTLQRLNFVDGYHFMNSAAWLRNNLKGVVLSRIGVDCIEFIFELFCFGIEAIIAQLKFLLEISGEKELADRIKLKFVEEIKLPEGIEKPKKEELKKFFEVRKQDGDKGYSIYHLGIPGNEAKGKKAVVKNRELLF